MSATQRSQTVQTPEATTQPRKSPTGSRHNAHGASGNRCSNNCVRPTPSQAHCAAGCHRTFGGVTGFDAHRKDGVCLDPLTLGMVRSDLAIWRTPMSDEARERLAGHSGVQEGER